MVTGEHEQGESTPESPKSGEIPHCISPVSDKVGNKESSNGAGYKAVSPLSPHSPLKNRVGGIDIENETRARGVAADNLSDEKAHSVSPLAVCLLLACCRKIEADE